MTALIQSIDETSTQSVSLSENETVSIALINTPDAKRENLIKMKIWCLLMKQIELET